MQKLVGKQFIAKTEQKMEIGAVPKGKKAALWKIDSPVLLQLLTFSVRR
ncbi:MAG: hypothetical protein R3D30_07090 [Hyphomicrobiales bacterium]